MNFPDALNCLIGQNARIKRADWQNTWLERRSTAAGPIIVLFMDGGQNSVSWNPTVRDLFDTTWEVYTEKPQAQVVKVPPNDFSRMMGDRST